MSRNQVDGSGAPDILPLMLRHQQEVGGKRHDLPHHDKEYPVAGHEQNRHRGGQQSVEERQAAFGGRVFGSRPVSHGKERAGGGDKKYREQKEGGKGIDDKFAGAERQAPFQRIGGSGAAEEDHQSGRHTGQGGQNCSCRRKNLAGARFAKEQTGDAGGADNKRGEERHERRVKCALQSGIHTKDSLE